MRDPFSGETDKQYYYDEQAGLLEKQMHQLKKPGRDVVFEASPMTIKGNKEKLHALIFKYGITTPDDASVNDVFAQIDRESAEKLKRGKQTNPEGLKMCYYFTMVNWRNALANFGGKKLPELTRRQFNVPIRRGTEYVYKDEEVEQLVKAAGNDRDKALVALAAGSALRRREIQYLRVEDLWEGCDGLTLHDHGQKLKSKNERTVPFIDGTDKYVRRWITVRAKFLRDAKIEDPGWVFITKNGTQMAPLTIYSIIRKLKDKEGIKTKGAVHGFRRYCLTSYGRSGVDISVVQDIAGHQRIETTKRYQRYDPKDLKEAAKKVKLFGRRT